MTWSVLNLECLNTVGSTYENTSRLNCIRLLPFVLGVCCHPNKLKNMSQHLYKAAASAELFGALVYLSMGLFASVCALREWGGPWFPLLTIASIVAFRLCLVHWRERQDLLKTAKEIEENEQTKS
jgi:hypothetical protein